MLAALRRNLLLVVIFSGLAMSLLWPGPGRLLDQWSVANPLLFLIFFCQGFALDDGMRSWDRKLWLAVLTGLLFSLFISPLLAAPLSRILGMEGDFRVGFFIMCAMAPTLVSGVVMSVRAGGDRTTALLLTIVLNMLGIVIIPFMLSWLLGEVVEIDRSKLLGKLMFFVLLPAACGYMAGRLAGVWRERVKSPVQLIPIFSLGLILYANCASQSDLWKDMDPVQVAMLVPSCLAFHFVLLLLLFACGTWLLRLGHARTVSLAIICSQKTLPIAMAVWTISFRDRFPLAIAVPIVFHFSQLLADSLIVESWARLKNRARQA